MRVAVLQSAYIPWRGYFDIISNVDLFVIYDDVQYSKGSWRNRNKVKLADGPRWLTVPVSLTLGDIISDVTINYAAKDWIEQHRGLLNQSLGKSPYFDMAMAPWEAAMAARPTNLSELNLILLDSYCRLLGIKTKFTSSQNYPLEGAATDRLLQLLTTLGATSYLSGPAAQSYLEVEKFQAAGIDIYYKSYIYHPYPQAFHGFQQDVSIVDLVANLGPSAKDNIKSIAPDEKLFT